MDQRGRCGAGDAPPGQQGPWGATSVTNKGVTAGGRLLRRGLWGNVGRERVVEDGRGAEAERAKEYPFRPATVTPAILSGWRVSMRGW